MTATTAWAHLPNAAHIDRVLACVRANPDGWATARDAARIAARDAIAARGAARAAARAAAWGAIAALIAWDYAGEFMSMPLEAVKFAAKTGDHAAVLLVPFLTSLEQIKQGATK